MADTPIQTSDQDAEMADLPPPPAPLSRTNGDSGTSAPVQSSSNGMNALIEAFAQLGTGDESPVSLIFPTVTPSSESIAMIPLAAHGEYHLFDHVPVGMFHELIRDITESTFEMFTNWLVENGYVTWENDELPIAPATRVAIMALPLQDITTRNMLNLPHEVIQRLVSLVPLGPNVRTARMVTDLKIHIFQYFLRGLRNHHSVMFQDGNAPMG